MKAGKRMVTLVIIALMFGSFSFAHLVFGHDEVILRDANGIPVEGTKNAYSPRRTCGLNGSCHGDTVAYDYNINNIYEDQLGYALKDNGPGTSSYNVPYPMHGVSAGFHSQMGRNISWNSNNNDAQRHFYQLPDFTSSPGAYGGFYPFAGRQLAGKAENNPLHFDMSSYDFGHSGCAWCHPGGGALEYDRDGYRYTGKDVSYDPYYFTPIFPTGSNPTPGLGDYYTYVSGQGITSKQSVWQTGGVAEVDCLMCHFQNQYANLERNNAPIDPIDSLGLMPSLGLIGAKGQPALLTVGQKGSWDSVNNVGINPIITGTTWKWNNIGAGVARIPEGLIVKTPPKENCALCHFADQSWSGTSNLGPANNALGSTVFQQYLAPGSTPDSDKVSPGTNDSSWYVMTERADLIKRGESINDPLNPDAHMDGNQGNMPCAVCHYLLGPDSLGSDGLPAFSPPQYFPPITDKSGNIAQDGVYVLKIDHQFARGNSRPDGANMDPLDNTATCESCHITRTHPNANGVTLSNLGILQVIPPAPDPTAAHSGFPAVHFNIIACRTCHIPSVNPVKKQLMADYTAGPYQNGKRGQYLYNISGINYKPLYLWYPQQHNGTGVQLQPVATMAVATWVDGGNSNQPVFQRTVQNAAAAYRSTSGSTNGIYNFTLNRPQNGDTALIVNTPNEITGMVNQLGSLGVTTPIMNIYVDTYTLSHNIAPLSSGRILGSPSSGGCLMCHSSSNPTSPNYSIYSVGLFDKTYTLFNQPVDGGNGLVQTAVNGVNRVNLQFSTLDPNGNPFVINLSGNNGNSVGNTLNETAVLDTVQNYASPSFAGYTVPTATFTWSADATTSFKVNFNATASTCGTGPCQYSWNYGDGSPIDTTSGTVASHTYAAAGNYSVVLTITNTSYGFNSTASQTVTAVRVNHPPVASYTTSIGGYTVTLTDTSTDPDNDPLTVKVIWGDSTPNSSAPGGSVIPHTYAKSGTYIIQYSVTDGIATSSAANQRVTVPTLLSISGTVLRANGTTPVSGATVSLYSGTSRIKTVTSAADGSFTMTGISPGSYTIQTSASGLTFNNVPVTVTSSNVTGLQIESTN